jgi:hypothetical protein
MTMPSGLQWLSWELLFKLLVLLSFLFTGYKTEQLTRVTDDVKSVADAVHTTTTKTQETVATTKAITQNNQQVLRQHEAVSEENAHLLATLRPLFEDIVQRQGVIRQEIGAVQGVSAHLTEETDRLTALLTGRTELLHQMQTDIQACLTSHAALMQHLQAAGCLPAGPRQP